MARSKRRSSLAILSSLIAYFALHASIGHAAQPVEGYRTRDGRVACVMYQQFSAAGNAVKCGRRGYSRGLLLTSTGAARRAMWRWPATALGKLFFSVVPGQTLYLYGGTAKVQGDDSVLRCRFTRSSVRCTNRDGYAIAVGRSGTRSIEP